MVMVGRKSSRVLTVSRPTLPRFCTPCAAAWEPAEPVLVVPFELVVVVVCSVVVAGVVSVVWVGTERVVVGVPGRGVWYGQDYTI